VDISRHALTVLVPVKMFNDALSALAPWVLDLRRAEGNTPVGGVCGEHALKRTVQVRRRTAVRSLSDQGERAVRGRVLHGDRHRRVGGVSGDDERAAPAGLRGGGEDKVGLDTAVGRLKVGRSRLGVAVVVQGDRGGDGRVGGVQNDCVRDVVVAGEMSIRGDQRSGGCVDARARDGRIGGVNSECVRFDGLENISSKSV
jgi:hypothetical protein